MQHAHLSDSDELSLKEAALLPELLAPPPTEILGKRYDGLLLVLESTPSIHRFFGEELPAETFSNRSVSSIYHLPVGVWYDRRKKAFARNEGSAAEPSLIRSNDPQELSTTFSAAQRCWGRVLCVGCGIGTFQQIALRNDAVQFVMTIESNKELVELTRSYLPHLPIIHTDPFEYLRTTEDKYDCIYFHDHNKLDLALSQRANQLSKIALRVLVPSSTSRMFAWGYFPQLALLQQQALQSTLQVVANSEILRMSPVADNILRQGDPFAWALLHWLKRWQFEQGPQQWPPPSEFIVEQAARIAFEL